MLVENIVMEASVSNSKARELSCVSVWVLAALDSSRNESELQQLFVEEPSMSTEISDQVADFGPDRSISVGNQSFQVIVNI